MSMWWVIKKDDMTMIYSCDDAGKERCSIGGDQEWLECVEGVSPGNCKVQLVAATEEVPEHRILVDGSADKASPQWDAMRKERNKRLAACDWTQMVDSPLSAQAKADWADFRQELRDLPSVSSDPEAIVWPVAP